MKHFALLTATFIAVVTTLCQCRYLVDESLKTFDHVADHMDSAFEAREAKHRAVRDSIWEEKTRKSYEDFERITNKRDSAFEKRTNKMHEDFEKHSKQMHDEFERKSKASQKKFEEDCKKMDEDFERERQRMRKKFEDF